MYNGVTMQQVTISSTISDPYPIWPYQKIKETILGKRYQLSLSFIGADRAKRLNEAYRGKDYVPNVLSFPLDTHMGEIYICPKVANREAANFDLSPRGYIAFLFIHGCFHLKGLDHGATMEKQEQAMLRKFKIK